MSRARRWSVAGFALALCVIAGLVLYYLVLAGLPDPQQPLGRAGTPSILITDRNGRALYEVIDPKGSKFVPLPLGSIPVACQRATIATEDSRFYFHPGVDPVAIVRALWQNWRSGHTVSGGSTLTQQAARNLYLAQDERVEHSLRRKLREAWLAWRLERTLGKDEVLALYLNTTYYGHFAVGIEAAAQAYFGQHAAELDLAQCALLAGLPQYPAGYNPIENPEAARGRQSVVLDLMQRAGYVSAEQAAEARKERLNFTTTPFPIEAPHFVMWVQSQLEKSLPPERLRGGGMRVVTTLDLDWQRAAEAIVARRLAQLRPCAAGLVAGCDPQASPDRRVDDAALVAIDLQTGAVRAMVGSAGYFDASISGAVNAALSLRQPGSAIKPITYAAAFDPERARLAGRAPWTPATLIADVRTVFPTAEGQPYVPQNYDRLFHGPVTARQALANSYNIPAVKTLQYIGVDTLLEEAKRLGIESWGMAGDRTPGISDWQAVNGSENPGAVEASSANAQPQTNGAPSPRFGLSLALGGGEVRLLDLTAAYAAFANSGSRVSPFGIERIEALDVSGAGGGRGSTLSAPPPAESRPTEVLDPRVAYLITDILSDAEARIPAFGQGSVLEIGRPAAAKTGTTTDWRDNWTIGYTPDLVTGVWVGNADNSPMMDISGITGAGPIWHDFMFAVLRDTPLREFAQPDGLVQVEVCADSGLLPGSLAPQGPGSPAPCPHRRLEWFIAGTEPSTVDTTHWMVALDARTGGPVTAATPPDAVRTDTFWQMPSDLQAWARDNRIPQPLTWLKAAQATGGQGTGPSAQPGINPTGPALTLTSPDPNRVYRLDPGLPLETQQIPVTAQPGQQLAAAGSPVNLFVDGQPLATVNGPEYSAWWRLQAGRHTLQAVSRSSDGAEVRSEPVTIAVVR